MNIIIKCNGLLLLLIARSNSEDTSPLTLNESLVNFIVKTNYAFCNATAACFEQNTSVPALKSNTTKDSQSLFSLGTLQVSPPDEPSSTCCGTCSCNDDCHKYENCCPGRDTLVPLETHNWRCTYPQLRPYSDGQYLNTNSRVIYHGCPAHYDINDMIKSKCENIEEYNTLDVNIPATDRGTNITYRNSYCAMCNGISEEQLEHWNPEIYCADEYVVISNSEQTLNDILISESCNLIYYIPSHLHRIVPLCTSYISKCNVTGLWKTYDPLIETACLAYKHIYQERFMNVFCYMCNTNLTLTENEDCYYFPGFGGGSFIDTSFTAILKFTPPSVSIASKGPSLTKSNQCQDDQIYDDIQDVCRNIVCYPPREYNDGLCISSVESIGGMTYQFYIKLSEVTGLSKVTLTEPCCLMNHFNTSMLGLLTSAVTFSGSVSRLANSDIETGEQMSETFLVNVKISVSTYFNMNYSVIQNILEFDGGILAIECDDGVYAEFSMSLVLPRLIDENMVLSHNDKCEFYTEVLTFEHEGIVSQHKTLNETIIPPIGCPLVGLPFNEFNIEMYRGGLYVHALQISLSLHEFVEIPFYSYNDTTIYICLSRFQNAITAVKSITNKTTITESVFGFTFDGRRPKGLVFLICTSLSVIGSLLTILTYSLFSELRTQPGLNNMMLTVNLLCAQTLLQFGSNQADNISDWACEMVGILIHFMWISTLAWMNVCSLHMFKVFRYNTRHKNEDTCLRTMKYTIYCFTVGALPVLINVVFSIVHTQTLGYGGRICYITQYAMVGFVFALPAGIIITANFVLFFAVVVTIRCLPHVDHASKNRNLIHIYIKLSTLCGLTWTFGYLYVVSGVDILEYIFIISNASQGVFIFISFVCNRRVLNLYLNLARTGKTRLSEHTRASRVLSS